MDASQKSTIAFFEGEISAQAKAAANSILAGKLGGEWKVENGHKMLELNTDQPWRPGIDNRMIMAALSKALESKKVGFTSSTPKMPPYVLANYPESNPPHFKIKLTEEFAKHLVGEKSLSKP